MVSVFIEFGLFQAKNHVNGLNAASIVIVFHYFHYKNKTTLGEFHFILNYYNLHLLFLSNNTLQIFYLEIQRL